MLRHRQTTWDWVWGLRLLLRQKKKESWGKAGESGDKQKISVWGCNRIRVFLHLSKLNNVKFWLGHQAEQKETLLRMSAPNM